MTGVDSMIRRLRAGTKGVIVIAAVAALGLLAPGPGAADIEPDSAFPSRSYDGAAFGFGQTVAPTTNEQQSKLWFHDGSWWAVMLEPSRQVARVHELMSDHSWRATATVINDLPADTGDALLDGDDLIIVTRRLDDALLAVRMTYDPAAREFVPRSTSVITTRGGTSPATIARDSTGRHWITFASGRTVYTNYSDDGGALWAETTILADLGLERYSEISAIAAFDRSIGVMWSDQSSGEFRFAVHTDGAPPTEWRTEVALAGPNQADNHISLLVIDGEEGDTVVAAVKTSEGDRGEPPNSPLIKILVRTPQGVWSDQIASVVGDRLNSPRLQVDTTNRQLLLLMDGSGNVVSKRTHLDAISFTAGPGNTLLIGGPNRVGSATTSRHPVDARTGLVVLAGGSADFRYHHAEVALARVPPRDPTDITPPSPPDGLWGASNGSGGVTLSWSAATDGERWAPATDGRPVASYRVLRDGVEVGRTTRTSHADRPPVHGRSYVYSVLAVDSSGNESTTSDTSVSTAVGDPQRSGLIGWLLLSLAAAGVTSGVAAVAWRFRQSAVI